MKTIRFISILSLALIYLLPSWSCGLIKTTGDINVTVVALQGETVDLNGISVQLHSASTFDQLLFSETANGSATSATASFVDLEEGKYYLCAWDDKDGDLTFSTDDVVAWYPYPIDLLAKDELNLTIEAYVED